MNVLRSLARDLVNLYGSQGASKKADDTGLNPLRQERVAPVVQLARWRDSFEQLPQGLNGAVNALKGERAFRQASGPSSQPFFSPPPVSSRAASGFSVRDGFEAASRRPVDLSGGAKPSFTLTTERSTPIASPSNAFTASLDDLLA